MNFFSEERGGWYLVTIPPTIAVGVTRLLWGAVYWIRALSFDLEAIVIINLFSGARYLIKSLSFTLFLVHVASTWRYFLAI